MGEPLCMNGTAGKVADGKLNVPAIIYAPVGNTQTLLALSGTTPAGKRRQHTLFCQPHRRATYRSMNWWPTVGAIGKLAAGRSGTAYRIRKFPLPRDLYGRNRINSAGLDLTNEHRLTFFLLPC